MHFLRNKQENNWKWLYNPLPDQEQEFNQLQPANLSLVEPAPPLVMVEDTGMSVKHPGPKTLLNNTEVHVPGGNTGVLHTDNHSVNNRRHCSAILLNCLESNLGHLFTVRGFQFTLVLPSNYHTETNI